MKIHELLLRRVRNAQSDHGSSRRKFLKELGLFTAGAGLLWSGCHQIGGVAQDSEAHNPSIIDGGGTVSADANQIDDPRPLMDQNPPANTQSATFALG